MRKWIVGVLGLCVVFSAYAKKQPNVVLLLTDDQSYHLGMLGVPHEMRNLAGNPESALVVKRLDKA